MANAKQRRRQARQRRRKESPVPVASATGEVTPADWDAPDEFPDTGARPIDPVEPHDAQRGPVLAVAPARRGSALNAGLLLVGAVALLAFGIWLLRA